MIDLSNYNELDIVPQLCTNYNARMSVDKPLPGVQFTENVDDSPQRPVLPSSVRQLMDWRVSNGDNRSSAGQFSIGSVRMSDLRLSLTATEKKERVSNPFEQPTQSNEATSVTVKGIQPLTKGCNCKRTQCLRGYCECFLRKEACTGDCNCNDCHNTQDNIEEVNEARERIRIKYASRSRIGCNCHKTMCLRNYCSCFRNGGGCGPECKCVGCENKGETISSEQKTDV